LWGRFLESNNTVLPNNVTAFSTPMSLKDVLHSKYSSQISQKEQPLCPMTLEMGF